MSGHLTIISYQQRMEPFLEGVAFRVRPKDDHSVRRCQDLEDLYGLVEQTWAGETRLLDLVGHGGPTGFRFGDELLLQSGQELPEAFKRLNNILPKETRLRLLGCFTGRGEEGLAMIRAASTALGGRVVMGATDSIDAYDFEESGLSGEYEKRFLIASDARFAVQPTLAVGFKWMGGAPEEAGKWQQLLPAEYQLIGRREPLAERDASLACEGATITFASARLLVLIKDDPKRSPLVLQWSSSAPPPALEDLMLAFQG